MAGLGRILFALSIAAIGALTIHLHDFAFAWRLAPEGTAWREPLAIAAGGVLLLGGIALLVPRTARLAALVLASVMLPLVLLLRVPALLAHPLVEGSWYGVSESFTFVAGAWTIFSILPTRDGEAFAKLGSVRLGQILFALTLPALGLAHFFYVNLTAPLIPSWLPFHEPLAYLTGAGHIAAGIAILLGIWARPAAVLEAVMVSLFTLIVWVPRAIATPTSIPVLTEILVSIAITGTAWAVAGSFRARA